MNKLELIQALKEAANLSKSEATAIVDIFFNEMTNALSNGSNCNYAVQVCTSMAIRSVLRKI
ncbi:HU family DNA-binding protein [Desulfosarcina ovata]|uniref:Integration host factor subunit beta n=1 Tax=Desulfosarcina ovata subsp. ovata TaxID=2752305 RepID=A0A5K8A538_9BACT|nr:HU family DNA-binding protein [Desulfosarcina ovata]BBO87546.1 hypothetical protein DSCOOX_07260 [Desulfosarcina ovata subsp. ovata]